MKRIVLFLFLVFFVFVRLMGQSTDESILEDTTIYLKELVFNNPKEKVLFEEIYGNKGNDYFSLFYLVKKDVDTSKIANDKVKFNKEIEYYKSKFQSSKDEKKNVKFIYNDVHNKFFTKYELINHFDDVFAKGYYNCLSATSIYSIIFESLKISYNINVLPNHVNLTVFPETHKILIETTNPIQGYFTYDKKFKDQYVLNLLSHKMIDKSELQLSTDELFEKYFNTNEVIDLKELVGVQYYNDGLYLMQEGNMEEAIEQLEKAVALYPSIKIGNVLALLYSQEIDKSDYSKEKQINYLIRVLRYKNLEIDFTKVENEIKKAADNLLDNKDDTSSFNSFFSKISLGVPNDSFKIDLTRVYFNSLGNYYLKNIKYKLASTNFLESLKIKKSEEIERLFISSIVFHSEITNNKKKVLDDLMVLDQEYPRIAENMIYLSYKAEIICRLMSFSFEQNEITEGENYRTQIENLYNNSDVQVNEINVGIAYAQAGACYFRKGNKVKAKMIFKKGLEYSPDNYELTSRLRMIGN